MIGINVSLFEENGINLCKMMRVCSGFWKAVDYYTKHTRTDVMASYMQVFAPFTLTVDAEIYSCNVILRLKIMRLASRDNGFS